MVFLVECTCPYINEFITQGNHEMNTDATILNHPTSRQHPVHCVRDGKLNHKINADGLHISNALSSTRSNSFLSRSLAAIFMHLRTFYERIRPCYERDRPYGEHHAPVRSIKPLLRLSCPATSLWHVATPNNARAVPFILGSC